MHTARKSALTFETQEQKSVTRQLSLVEVGDLLKTRDAVSQVIVGVDQSNADYCIKSE